MQRSILKRALCSAAAGMLCCAGAVHAQAQASPQAQTAEVADFYDYYAVGYDTNYDDDWFFDYFAYDVTAYEPQYDHYADYDYQADAFDWEQTGQFEPRRGRVGNQPQRQPSTRGRTGREP